LAPHFNTVIATDASAEQIASAEPQAGMQFRVAPAEASGLASNSIDLVTVAQALHWFDVEQFFAETIRVLKPGGVLAFWCYTHSNTDPDCDEIVRKVFAEVESYWPPERAPGRIGYAGDEEMPRGLPGQLAFPLTRRAVGGASR
jgi:ubiquinone/menaquinone biosynthesis C-methylase UbiE